MLYMGTNWLIIETINFMIEKYHWQTNLIDYLVSFGALGVLPVFINLIIKKGGVTMTRLKVNLLYAFSIAIPGVMLIYYFNTSPITNEEAYISKNHTAMEMPKPRIMVLPSNDLNNDIESNHVTDILINKLIMELMNKPSINVVYWNNELPELPFSNKNIHVDYLIKCTLQEEKTVQQINLVLFDAATNVIIWNEIFELGMNRDSSQDITKTIIEELLQSSKLLLTHKSTASRQEEVAVKNNFSS